MFITLTSEDLVDEYQTIFSKDLKDFVVKICRKFDEKIDRFFVDRLKSRLILEERELNEVDESLESLANFIENTFGCKSDFNV